LEVGAAGIPVNDVQYFFYTRTTNKMNYWIVKMKNIFVYSPVMQQVNHVTVSLVLGIMKRKDRFCSLIDIESFELYCIIHKTAP